MTQIIEKIILKLEEFSQVPFIIQEDSVACDFLQKLLIPSLKTIPDFITDATKYWKDRDLSDDEQTLRTVKENSENILNNIFENYNDVKVILMSSYGARMHVRDTMSDIDFGIIVRDINGRKIQKYSKILTGVGFIIVSVNNGITILAKTYMGISVEAKIRGSVESEAVILLHWFLDEYVSEKTKKLLTYVKYLVKDNKKAYDGLKYVIYCGYMTYLKQLKCKMG